MARKSPNAGTSPPLPTLPGTPEDFALRLLAWYGKARRPLPWRSDPDPYRVWVSEIMLQQTRVETVLPYFRRFLKRYPRLEDLARAQEEEVLGLWSGLGYYSRARNLHRAARLICREHQGEFPRSYESAMRLPGVGRYTAGAVLSIAYGLAHPVLDGNVRRVLSRYLWIEEPLPDGTLWRWLEELVQRPAIARQVGHFNQALMELGALVCTPRAPLCSRCPLAARCRARQSGRPEELPRPRPSRARQELQFFSAVIRRDGQYLLRQNREGPFLRDFWEFPRVEKKNGPPEPAFRNIHALDLEIVAELPPVTHQITFRRLRFHPLLARLRGPCRSKEYTWSSLEGSRLPVSSYVRKIASLTAGTGESDGG